jgi:HEXXH motif-containing protein
MPMETMLLSKNAFRGLATGDIRPATIDELADGQRYRRMVMLRALLDAAAGDPATAGPLPSVARAWDALERIQATAPTALDSVLQHPQVGSWLAYTLRRHRGGASGEAPSHIDFGQLNTVALAAATSAGTLHRTAVPLRDGRVMVPRFGMATFQGCLPWDTAVAWTEAGRLRLRHGSTTVEVPADGDGPGWMALRSVTVVEEDLSLTVFLDDLDPWRDLADPVGPVRLTNDEFGTWATLLRDAWTVLVRHHRPVAEGLAACFTSLAPLPAVTDWDTRSASTGDAFGAIMCSRPPGPVTLAVSLAHEFRHIALGALMHLVPLTEGPGEPCLYAPWRDDPRPAAGLLQGIYAFHGIADFWRHQRRVPGNPDPRLDDFEYAYSRAQTREAVTIALADGNLTEQGRNFVNLMAASMEEWNSDRLDPEAEELARLVADSHRAGWLIRHRHPDTGFIAALAAAWREQRVPPSPERSPATVRPDPEMRHWSGARLGLARRRLVAPEQYTQAGRTSWGTSLSDADLKLFAGDATAAAGRFAADLAADPQAEDAWTGLGLALRQAGGSPTADVLLDHPDVVMALHRELGRTADPAALAAWLAGSPEK